jgi:hypothetical protein
MHSLFMVVQLILLTWAIVGLLFIVGIGVVLFAIKDAGATELFFGPLVGLTALYWVSQWLSTHFASDSTIIVTCIVLGMFSLVMLWRRRHAVSHAVTAARVPLALLVLAGTAVAVVVQIPTIHAGTLTLWGQGGDDLMAWAPVSTYMQSHTYVAGHPTAYATPLLWLLPLNIYPGSAGTVDGGLLSIFGMPAYQFVEPFSAVCVALTTCSVYALVRSTLRLPRSIAVIAVLIAATSVFRFWILTADLAQAARGTVVMMLALILIVRALQNRSIGTAVLAGAVTGVLAAVYMPCFLITAAALVGGVATMGFRAFRAREEFPWRLVGAIAAGGIVFGIQNIKWLALDGGLSGWEAQTHYGLLPYDTPDRFQALLGTSPFHFVWHFWLVGSIWSGLAFAVAAIIVLLTVLGAVHLARSNPVAGACLILPFFYGAFVFADNRNGIGSLLTIAYLSPITCALTATGLFALWAWIRQPRAAPKHRPQRAARPSYRIAMLLGSCAALVVLFQAVATSQDEAYAMRQPGMLSPENLHLSALASVIPPHATVLMYAIDGSNGASSFHKTQTLADAAIFLPGRGITIDGTYFGGLFDRADAGLIRSHLSLGYEYILHVDDPTVRDPAIPPNYHAVWHFAPDHLVLYEKST